MASSNILVVVALSACIINMVSMFPQGEAQLIPTPLNCFRTANNVPGCLYAFKQAIFHKNATSLTPDCCKVVNGLNNLCSLILFPTQPQGITILKAICSFVNSPPPAGSDNSATPPPQGSTATPSPSTGAAPPTSAAAAPPST